MNGTRAKAQKRGGGRVPISMDTAIGENSFKSRPADILTAEKIFERRLGLWALLEQVLRRCGRIRP